MNTTADEKSLETMISDHGDDLCHYGVPDQKHGVRRYQYMDGRLTPLGRLHYGIGFKNIGQVEAARRAKAKAEKEKEEAKERKRAENVDRVTRTGNAEEIYKFREVMTDQELTRAVQRMNATKQLESAIEANAKKQVPDKKSLFKSSESKKQTKIEKKIEDAKKKKEDQKEQQKRVAEAIDTGTQQLTKVTKLANAALAALATYDKVQKKINDKPGGNTDTNLPVEVTFTSNDPEIRIIRDNGSSIINNILSDTGDYIIPSGDPEPFRFELTHSNLGGEMMESWIVTRDENVICHYGVKGMKWHKHLYRIHKGLIDASAKIAEPFMRRNKERYEESVERLHETGEQAKHQMNKKYSIKKRAAVNAYNEQERMAQTRHKIEEGRIRQEQEAIQRMANKVENAKKLKEATSRRQRAARAQANTIKAGQQNVKKILNGVHKNQRIRKSSTSASKTQRQHVVDMINKHSNAKIAFGTVNPTKYSGKSYGLYTDSRKKYK